jgi:hypothetical protein
MNAIRTGFVLCAMLVCAAVNAQETSSPSSDDADAARHNALVARQQCEHGIALLSESRKTNQARIDRCGVRITDISDVDQRDACREWLSTIAGDMDNTYTAYYDDATTYATAGGESYQFGVEAFDQQDWFSAFAGFWSAAYAFNFAKDQSIAGYRQIDESIATQLDELESELDSLGV